MLFRLVPKLITLDDLEQLKRILAEKNCFTEPTRKISMKIFTYLSVLYDVDMRLRRASSVFVMLCYAMLR